MKRLPIYFLVVLFSVTAFAAQDSVVVAVTIENNDVDWCNLQWPASETIRQGNSLNVYAQVWEDGVTNGAGQGTGISAWIGYSSSNADPSGSGWTWVEASYNTYFEGTDNDEYMVDLGAAITAAGTYYYVSRFSMDGTNYKYGGYNSGGGGFWDGSTNVSGVLTIEPNNLPVLTAISDLTMTEDIADTLVLVATDADDDPITFSVTGGSESTVNAVVSHDTLFLIPAANYFTSSALSIIVTATDVYGGADKDTFLVTVTNVNDAPIIATPTIPAGLEGQQMLIDLSASDADNDVLSWSSFNLPSGASFKDNGNGTAQFSWTPDYTQAGTYPNIKFVVTDQTGKSASMTVKAAPKINKGNLKR